MPVAYKDRWLIKHAIIGSRKWPRPDDVVARVHELHERHGKDWILVSGGADGVCMKAEETHMALGGPVLSFRPARLLDEGMEPRYGVEEWRLVPGGSSILILHRDLVWADYAGAAMWRSMLIAERADHGDAFWNGWSRGTGMEIDFFEGAQTRLKVTKP